MDPSNDYYFLHDVLGKSIQITLKCGTFQGVLQHVDSSQSIFLNRVKNMENGRKVPGIKKFFGHEIVNVELLRDAEHAEEENTTATEIRKTPTTEMSAVDRRSQLKPKTYKVEDVEDNIEYIVIDQFQKKFGSAIMHIKKQNVCSVAAEGVNLCRYGRLSWLQVATKSQVFLFDIFLLGARVFKNGLQIILEDHNILKVIHDCRWLSDCLSHQYGIVLSNVFDTQVADVLQFSMETGGFLPHRISTLQECLMRYLRQPDKYVSFLDYRQAVIEKNPEIWFERPLPPALLNVLALETVYLLPLRLLLLDELMSDLTTLVDGYLNAFRKGLADPLGSIEISSMELPEELRQLADFYSIRKKTALQKFHLSEGGLLIRKQVEPLRRKMSEKESNPKTFLSSSGPLWLHGAQDNYEKEETYRHSNQDPTIGNGNIESELGTKGEYSCKLTFEEMKMKKLLSTFKPPKKISFTSEKDISQVFQ